MKILLAGDFQFAWYEDACAKALEELGEQVIRFSWNNYLKSFAGRIESHFVIPGPCVYNLNRSLLKTAVEERPDIILIWRGINIRRSTILKLKSLTGAILTSYNHDDAFSPLYAKSRNIHLRRVWSNFIDAIPEYDIHFIVRKQNIKEYMEAGAKRAHLLKQFFVPHLHRPIELSPQDLDKYGCDVVFVGHYEDDGRLDCIRALYKEGIKVRLYGTGWNNEIMEDLYDALGPVRPVYMEEYVKALCSSKLCLSFVSKLNRDTYTSRTFEIPACRAVLLSERTEDINLFYKEDVEAVFFSSPAEAVRQATLLLADEEKRLSIAESGYKRCIKDGHDSLNRMKELLEIISGSELR